MTALQPKFQGVTLACDDSMTIQTHKVMLVDISTVSGGLLRNHPEPYPLVYVREGTSTQFEDKNHAKRGYTESLKTVEKRKERQKKPGKRRKIRSKTNKN